MKGGRRGSGQCRSLRGLRSPNPYLCHLLYQYLYHTYTCAIYCTILHLYVPVPHTVPHSYMCHLLYQYLSTPISVPYIYLYHLLYHTYACTSSPPIPLLTAVKTNFHLPIQIPVIIFKIIIICLIIN